jgi:hypothetical protein
MAAEVFTTTLSVAVEAAAVPPEDRVQEPPAT